MKTGLSVVIPAYNEEANIAACLEKVSSVLKKLKDVDSEIIVVDDGSKDKTGEIARSYIKKISDLKVVTNKPNRGYGGSLKAGFAASTKEFIVFTPGDNQFDFAEVTKLLEKQQETGVDIVSGIRVGGGVDPFHRRLNRWGWNTVVRALFGYLATDIDCGFKLFRREILNHVHTPAERGAMIDTQLFASARARGFTVAEVPLTHLPRTAGKSTGANPRVIIQSFIDLFTFWWQLKKEILVERGLAVFPWEAACLFAVLILGLFSRVYKIDQYMTFLGDEGRDAIVMRDIVTGSHYPLLGPGTSVGSMYLGPLYYYLVAPSLALANYSPVGPAIEVALIGVLTIALLWWISRQWFGRTISLGISALYALSPTVIDYSRSSWNPNVMPFFALLAVYSLWKVWRFGYWRWLLIGSLSLAFVLNSHYLGLLLLPVYFVYWFISKKTSESKKYTLLSLIVFLVLMSPLFFFDLRHDWQNFSAVKTFFTQRQTTVNLKIYKSLPNIWPIFTDMITTVVTGKNPIAGLVVSIALVVTTLYAAITKRINKDHLLIIVWVIFGLLGLGLYKQHIYAHYYGFLFPALFLLLGFCLYVLPLKKTIQSLIVFVVSGTLIIINLQNHPLRFSPNNQLRHTQEVSKFIQTTANGQPFNLALVSKTNYDASYRYFLSLSNAPYYTIHQKLADQLFVICEGECEPINNKLWEIAAFGWAKIDNRWDLPQGVTVYQLSHNPSGK